MPLSPILIGRPASPARGAARRRPRALEIAPRPGSSAVSGARRAARGGAPSWGWLRALLGGRCRPPSVDDMPVLNGSGNKIPGAGQ